MAIKTEIRKIGDTMVVSMGGKLNYEIQEPLRENLHKLANQAHTDQVPKKIILNLQELEFVGSSGISNFVQTLRDFTESAPIKPRYCNVKSEFRRMMQALDDNQMFEFHDNEERARRSFDQ